MSTQSSTIVQRLWNYCNVLRDDGMSYGDYVEQLTYLLFLKMDQENPAMLGKPSALPQPYNCQPAQARWRCARRPAREERSGHQERRGPILHPARPDQGHRGGYAPAARADHLRPDRGHRRLPTYGA